MRNNLAYKDQALPGREEFLQDVVDGLTSTTKTLPCKYFYDERGSQLFEEICETPEYYVTRTEIALLEEILPDISHMLGSGCSIVEFGAGAGIKIRLLLDALDSPASYTPMDISEEILRSSAIELQKLYPKMRISPWVGDYTTDLDSNLRRLADESRQVVFFPGSTISNFTPGDAVDFLSRIGRWLGKDGVLLIGVDTVKPSGILDAAYNDSAGVTAEFNLNILHRLKNDLDIQINPGQFSHQAFFNADRSRIEMHLVSDKRQSIELGGNEVVFLQGETIHTENSYKYDTQSFQRLANKAGFRIEKSWLEENGMFSFYYLVVG